MKTQKLKNFKSSNVRAAQYDQTKKQLSVTFKSGSTYLYNGINQLTWHGLEKAKSKGHYLFKKVKNKHDGVKQKP